MSEPDDIPNRVTRLEREVPLARSDAAKALILARGADRDVAEVRAELKAHTKVLNALGETQREHGQELREMRAEMREGFAKMGVGMAQITALLTNASEESGES